MLRGIGLSAAVLTLTLLPAGAAQEVGESYTILVPEGELTSNQFMLEVTGSATDAIAVGDCFSGQFRPQAVDVVPRARPGGGRGGRGGPAAGELPPVTQSQVIVIDLGYRNDPPPFNGIELALGTRFGSFGGGGDCGPGYQSYFAHVITGDNDSRK